MKMVHLISKRKDSIINIPMINDNVILNHLLLHNIHQMLLVKQMFRVPNVKVAVLDEIVNALERVLWV